MLLFNTTPSNDPALLADIYARSPAEGMVHSGVMHGHHFPMAENFDESLSCASISWASGGEEQYHCREEGVMTLRAAGALTLARGARYAYFASSEAPFRSSTIYFPHWITGADPRRLATRLIRPDPGAQSLMDALAGACRRGEDDDHHYTENMALLYGALLDQQEAQAAAADNIDAVKASTRRELARRVGVARTVMLARFGEADLSLDDIAREACLSPYHLIRVFRRVAGASPMQYLAMIRMDAALRLLRETRMNVGAVAAAAGYADRTAFFKAFRKRHGCAPSAVRG